MGDLRSSDIESEKGDAVFVPAETSGDPERGLALQKLRSVRDACLSKIKISNNANEKNDLAERAADADLLIVEVEKIGAPASLREKLEGDIRSLGGALEELENIGAKSYLGELFKIKTEKIARKKLFERRLALLKRVANV